MNEHNSDIFESSLNNFFVFILNWFCLNVCSNVLLFLLLTWLLDPISTGTKSTLNPILSKSVLISRYFFRLVRFALSALLSKLYVSS